jgi:DNA-binding MarR family transcriptional regulator
MEVDPMSNSDPLVTLNPSIVGQAEKAHTAILKRLLRGTTLDEHQWITVQLATGFGDTFLRGELESRVAGAAKYDPESIEAAIDGLIRASLIEEVAGDPEMLAVTAEGRALVSTLRAEVRDFVERAYGSVPPEDLATAAAVLTTITTKLSEELDSQGPSL